MNLEEYQKNAIRTESIIEKLEFNKLFITALFKLFVTSSEILDGVKKEVYYNKSTKVDNEIIPLLYKMQYLIENAIWHFPDRKYKDQNIELNPRVFHGVIGIATEAGELVDVLVKNLDSNKPIDTVNVFEEIHDISWYQAILHECLDLKWEEGLDRNIAKLKARFPDKFSEEKANNRDLETERKILEGNQ